MLYRPVIRCLSLILASLILVEATGCQRVAEVTRYSEQSKSVSSVTFTENSTFTDKLSETVGNTSEISESTAFKTEINTVETSITTTVSEKIEITSENTVSEYPSIVEESTVSETAAETTAETQHTTTVLTIQSESPSETEKTTEKTTFETTVHYYNENSYNALNFREQKGFWITYLEYGSILKNKSKSSFKKEIGNYFDNIADLGFNTVYVQVRAFGDAYYNSSLFPSGEQFDGIIGTENCFDALQIMIDCAHERGMSIHAWVNPMRLMTTAQLKNIDDSYIIKKWYNSDKYNGTYIVKSGDRWYLNPAYKAVTDLIASGITEIAANYDVDGIQIDDYFYPTTAESFDKIAYKASETELSLSDWRISNVNTMVKKLYNAAHDANDSILFGISPQGSVENNYNELYADVNTWCAKSGYCDYILPQVYFGFDNAALPYKDVLLLWSSMVKTSSVKLVIGLAAYKIGAVDAYAGSDGKNEWLKNDDMISRQMSLAAELDNYGGVAIYRYDSLFNPTSEVAAHVNKEIKNIEK